MLSILSDGQPHAKEELHCCLYDDQGSVNNVRQHVVRLRRKLEKQGEYIVCEIRYRRAYYRQVRLLQIKS
jgi:hypothetical protein